MQEVRFQIRLKYLSDKRHTNVLFFAMFLTFYLFLLCR